MQCPLDGEGLLSLTMKSGVLGAPKMASELSKRANALGWVRFFKGHRSR